MPRCISSAGKLSPFFAVLRQVVLFSLLIGLGPAARATLEQWSARASGNVGDYLTVVIWNGSQFVAVGGNTHSGDILILTSPDGLAWTRRVAGVSGTDVWDIAWNGSQFVAVGSFHTAMTSPDAVTWTIHDSGTASRLRGVVWGGGQFVAVGDAGTILTSPDGVTWTPHPTGYTTTSLWHVAWNGNQFVTVGEAGLILTSPDGVTWTPQRTGTNREILGIAWNGRQFVAVGGDGLHDASLTSSDGVSWSSETIGATDYVDSVGWSGNQFLAVGNHGAILSSSDGASWTTHHSGTTTRLNGVASNGSRFVVVADGATILIAEEDAMPAPAAITTEPVSQPGHIGQVTAFNVGASGLPGPALQWQRAPAGSDNFTNLSDGAGYGGVATATLSVRHVTTGSYGDRFRCVATNASGPAATSLPASLTAPAGLDLWTQRNPLATELHGVASNGNRLVAVGAAGSVSTSADGQTWTAGNAGVPDDLWMVIWNGSRFVAVGNSGTILT